MMTCVEMDVTVHRQGWQEINNISKQYDSIFYMSIHFAAHLLESVCTVNTLASHLYKNTLSVITICMLQMLYIDIRFFNG